ncbi:hypothetical protein MMC34_001318 [Xylographa carneopallida]|nr:hypothetical protein [Xylographa carneopallida]
MSIVGRNATTLRNVLIPLRKPLSSNISIRYLNRINGVSDIVRPVASIRRFHASPFKQSEVLDTCMSQAHNVFANIHSFTELPWVLALPLTAFLVRLCLITPLNIYSHQTIRRQTALQPLLYAWASAMAVRIAREHGTQIGAVQGKKLKKELKHKRSEIYKRSGIRRWMLFAPLINFPVWLVFMETIRRMCGTQEGLLGLIAKAVERPRGDEAVVPPPPVETDVVSAYFEPSMAVEGSLWFPDLLVADPMLILPFALSACFYATIVQQDRRLLRKNGVLLKWQTRRSRMAKLVVLAIGPLTLHLPSAMLIYWMASSLTVLGQTILLDFVLPIPPAVLPLGPKRQSVWK